MMKVRSGMDRRCRQGWYLPGLVWVSSLLSETFLDEVSDCCSLIWVPLIRDEPEVVFGLGCAHCGIRVRHSI
ncbi:hypothetical protein D1871_11250 [Nakamurella silvestris]|nr:hypothetical protein D1871_11250 [Nakamurella silvestris]